jgi:hypothetical protein
MELMSFDNELAAMCHVRLVTALLSAELCTNNATNRAQVAPFQSYERAPTWQTLAAKILGRSSPLGPRSSVLTRSFSVAAIPYTWNPGQFTFTLLGSAHEHNTCHLHVSTIDGKYDLRTRHLVRRWGAWALAKCKKGRISIVTIAQTTTLIPWSCGATSRSYSEIDVQPSFQAQIVTRSILGACCQ